MGRDKKEITDDCCRATKHRIVKRGLDELREHEIAMVEPSSSQSDLNPFETNNDILQDIEVTEFDNYDSPMETTETQALSFSENLNSSYESDTNSHCFEDHESLNDETNDQGQDIFAEKYDEQMKFIEKLQEYKNKHNATNCSMDDLLKLFVYYEENRDKGLIIPTSNYRLEQCSKIDLDSKYGFVTPCCQKKVLMSKDNIDACPFCSKKLSQRAIITSPNTFLQYNLKVQLEHLLNKFDLMKEVISDKFDSFFDCEYYQKFKASKEEGSLIAVLDVNCDGFDLTKKHDLWPLFFNVLNLDAPIDTKIFLNSIFKATNKPDIDFFLNDIIAKLNSFSNEGIYIERYQRKVYVFLCTFIADVPARACFLSHRNCQGEYGCTYCFASGERISVNKGTSRVFPFRSSGKELRSNELHLHIFNHPNKYEIDQEKDISSFGLKKKSILYEIDNFDVVFGLPPEPMHQTFIGTEKYNFATSTNFNFKDYPSYINKKQLEIIDKRIRNFPINSEFKRKIEEYSHFDQWKASQSFEHFFYVKPITLNSLIDQRLYQHQLKLVYIIGLLWNGGLDKSMDAITELKGMVKSYLSKMQEYYPNRNETYNNHQSDHLVDGFVKNGPYKYKNAFIYESKNKDVKNLVHGFYGVLEQIDKRFQSTFRLNLLKEYKPSNTVSVKSLGRPFKMYGRTCFNKIQIDKKTFTSYNSSRKTICKDYFCETIDERFFRVDYYYLDSCELFLVGKEIQPLSYYKVENLELKHLIHANQTDILVEINTKEIKNKIIFVPDFKEGSEEIVENGLGTIIRTIFTFHN